MYRQMHRDGYAHSYEYTYPFFVLCIEFHVASMNTPSAICSVPCFPRALGSGRSG